VGGLIRCLASPDRAVNCIREGFQFVVLIGGDLEHPILKKDFLCLRGVCTGGLFGHVLAQKRGPKVRLWTNLMP
jgi:hypothetical protein